MDRIKNIKGGGIDAECGEKLGNIGKYLIQDDKIARMAVSS
jgi:hypothetical protein